MYIIKEIIKSNSRQKKPKQNNLTFTSLEKIWDLSSMRLVNRSTKRAKKFNITLHNTVTNVIRYQLKSQNIHLYLHWKQLRHVIIQCSIAQKFKANGTNDYRYKL